jgi:hypothetical protein
MTQNLSTFFFQNHPEIVGEQHGEKKEFFSPCSSPSNSGWKHGCMAALGVYQLYIFLHLILPVRQHLQQHYKM